VLRKDLRRSSIVDRVRCLEQIVAFPDGQADNDVLIAALSAQGSFAKLETDGFIGMSLNALKKLSDEELEGGFASVDALRKKALTRLKLSKQKETQTEKPYTKADLVTKLKAAKDTCGQLQGELMVATMCLMQLMQSHEHLAAALGTDRERKRFKKERQEILSLFSHGVQSDVALAKFQNVVLFKNAR